MTKPGKQSIVSILDDDMIMVPKDFFFDGMILPVTIYFKMSPNSFLTIGRKGDKANFRELASFRNPNFKIFVESKDHLELIDFVTKFTEKVMSRPVIPQEVKAKFLGGLVGGIMNDFSEQGVASGEQMQKISKFVLELSSSLEAFDDIYRILNDMGESESKHALSTCMIANLIAEEMQITHHVALEKLSMAAMLHDVGLRYVPKEILNKPKHLWTPDERQVYEQHPLKGAEVLRDIKEVPNDVLLMIVEHHEQSTGTGYPKRLRDVKISPLGKILIVANEFSSLLANSKAADKSQSSIEALDYIEEVMGQPFNRQVVQALKNLVNKKYLSDKQKKSA